MQSQSAIKCFFKDIKSFLIFDFVCNSGPRAVLRFNTELQGANDPQLDNVIKLVKNVKENGNHVTALLSYLDFI